MAERPQTARDGPTVDKLTSRQQRALAALLEAPTAKKAAELAGISERQMKRYRADPDFQAAFRAAQADLVEGAVLQSRRNLSGALSTLAEIAVDEGQPAAARVSAARSTVELSLKLTEAAEIKEQLTALEEWQNGKR